MTDQPKTDDSPPIESSDCSQSYFRDTLEAEREPVTLYFTMVKKHCGEFMRVGKPFRSKESAKSWVPFVQSSWIGHRVSIRSCKITFGENGRPDEKTTKRLDREFNIEV